MPTIQIKNFKGMVDRAEGRWVDGHAKYVRGMDVFGLQDNFNQLSIPGVMQSMRTISAGTEASGVSAVTGSISEFAEYNTGAYAFEGTATPRLYFRNAGTWTVSADPGFLTAANLGGVSEFNNNLFVFQNAQVSRWNGSGWTAAFGTLANSTAPHIGAKSFGANLFIPDGRVVSKIDSTPTFTASALTLPAGYTVVSMEIFGDRLFISAYKESVTRIFVWDGTSPTYQSFIDMPDESAGVFLKFFDGNLWGVGSRNGVISTTPIYVFNQTTPISVFMMPFKRGSRPVVLSDMFLIGCNEIAGASGFEDGSAGIWAITKRKGSNTYEYFMAFEPANIIGTQVGPLLATAGSLYAFYYNSIDYQIYELQSTNNNTSASWQSLPIDANDSSKKKIWHSIKLDIETTISSLRAVVVKYRVDYATSWTTLTTITSTTSRNLFYHIGKVGNVIEIRVELATTAASQSTRVHGLSLDYSITKA